MSMLPFVFKRNNYQTLFNSQKLFAYHLGGGTSTAGNFRLNKFLKIGFTLFIKTTLLREFIKKFTQIVRWKRLRNLSYLLKSTHKQMIIGIDVSSIAYGTGVSNYTLNLVRHLLKE